MRIRDLFDPGSGMEKFDSRIREPVKTSCWSEKSDLGQSDVIINLYVFFESYLNHYNIYNYAES
jgi:hypothetical protein